MPYINRNSRPVFDPQIEQLSRVVGSAGELNYVISRLLSRLVAMSPRADYETMNSYLGAVRGAAVEFERRVLAPYEDRKCQSNGDVFDEVIARAHRDAQRRLGKIARGER